MKRKLVLMLLAVISVVAFVFGIAGCASVEYELNFIVDDEVYATIDTSGDEVIRMPEDPEKEDYVFDGWYWDKDTWQRPFTANSLLDEPISSDMSVYAKWIEEDITKRSFTVSFNSFGGSAVSDITVQYGKLLSEPSAPTRAGYVFVGWYKDADLNTEWNFAADTVTEDITLYAKWVDESDATGCDILSATGFEVDGNTLSIKVPNSQENFVLSEAITVSPYAEWTVTSDITGNTEIPSATVPLVVGDNTYYINVVSGNSSNKNQYTVEIRRREMYTVTYQLNNGSADIEEQVEEDNIAPTKTIEKTGYTFNCWQYNGSEWDFVNDIVVSDMTLTAVWTANTYDITFESNGGDAISATTATYDVNFEFSVPTRKGYTFNGWETEDGTKITDAKGKSVAPWSIAADTLLYADWSAAEYSITYYNIDGATNSNPVKYTVEDEIVALVDAQKAGYTFLGWYSDESMTAEVEQIDTSSAVGIELWAKWTIIEYTATFKDGETVVSEVKFTVEIDSITEPVVPEHIGYTGVWESYALGIENITINAVYTPVTYTITYTNTKDAENSNSIRFTIESDTITFSDISANGYTFDGWYNGEDKVTEITTGTYGDIALEAKWTPIEYTITYEYDDTIGDLGDEITLKTTYTIEDAFDFVSLNCHTAGYNFAGWFTEKELGTGEQVYGIALGTTGNKIYYAQWGLEVYSITYENVEGATNTNPDTYTVESQTFTLSDVSKIGYRFDGWYSDAHFNTPAKTTIETGSYGDLTFYAKWSLVSYDITYNLYGGSYESESNPASYNIETSVTLIEPVLEGAFFAGWYTLPEGGKLITEIPEGTTGNITLYARWITFDSNGGSAIEYDLEYSENGVTPPVAPEKAYYDFAGWYLDEQFESTYDFSNLPHSTCTLYAKWTPTEYVINYVLYDGINNESNPATYNVEDVVTFAVPSKTGYTFNGWYSNAQFTGALVEGIELGSYGEITIYASFSINEYTISFETNGGTTVAAITQNYGTSVTVPASPSKTGYRFVGWYADAELKTPYTFTTIPAEDITVYAAWTLVEYEIVYNLDGGTNDETNPVVYNIESEEIVFAAPSKLGYEFAGWFSDVTFENAVTSLPAGSYGEIELFAKWNIIEYEIEYVTADGTVNENALTYTVETDVTELLDAILKGHTFNGWYSDADYTKEVTTFGGGSVGDITLYAKFTANTYDVWLDGSDTATATVTFDLNGASGTAPASQTITETNTLTYPEVPERSGYIFGGWYANEACEGQPYDFSGLVGSDITLYAKWVKVSSVDGGININDSVSFELKGTAEKNYIFVPLASGNVSITTTGSVDTLGTLYKDGVLLKQDDDSAADGSNFLIVYNVTAGEVYEIRVRGFSTNTDGSVTLSIAGTYEVSEGGYTQSGNKVSVTYGSDFTLPVPEGGELQKFLGWQDENGVMYTDGSGASIRVWDKDGVATLFSKWERMEYTITFVTSGGSEIAPVTLEYGARVDINQYITTRSGYSFVGWYLAISDSVPYNATVMPDHDIILYARWTAYALNAIKFDEDAKAISALRDATVEDFGAICFDTDGNIVEISIAINGILEAGQTVTVRLTASANGKTRTETITNVKVYGLPTLEFNDQIDYFNVADGLSAEWFDAVGTDTYGEPTIIDVYVEENYGAGDTVTITIASIDAADNVKYGYVDNVKVYGNPEIRYDEMTSLSSDYNGSEPAFGATATDSFGKELVTNTFIINKMFVNEEYHFASSGYYRQDIEALFFDVNENDIYTFYHDKRNNSSTNWSTGFVIYNITDRIIVKQTANSGLSSSTQFAVEANKTYCVQILDGNRLNYGGSSVTIYIEDSNGDKIQWYRLTSYISNFSGYTTTNGEQIVYFSADNTTNYYISATVSARTALTIYDCTDNVTAYSNTSFSSSIRDISFEVKRDHTYRIAIRPYGGSSDNQGSFRVTLSDGMNDIGLYNALYPLEEKNSAFISTMNSTYQYMYFMPIKDEELTFYCQTNTFGGGTTFYASFVLSNMSTGTTIQTISNVSYNSGLKTFSFPVKAGEIYRIRVSANNSLSYTTYITKNDGSYVMCFNDQLAFGSLIAGQSATVTMLAMDSKGNMTVLNVDAKVFGTPVINEPQRIDFRVDEEITVESLGVSAQDSYGNNLEVSLELQSGSHSAGQILTYLITAVDSVGNLATKTVEVKIYGEIFVEYGLQGATETSSTADDLGIRATDSFDNELDIRATLIKGNLVAGQTVTFKIYVCDIAGNVYEREREYRVYSVDDIKLTYNAWLTDKIKLTSCGEEFEATATDTYGENCRITIEACEGFELAGGQTISLYIVATDKAGNIKKSEIISGIKVYDTPTASLTDESKGYFVNDNDDISFLFTVYDSFGEELYAEITTPDELVGGAYINITVSAVDDAGNVFEEVYQFRVLTTNAIDVDLYVDGVIWKSLSVTDGTNYTLEIPDTYVGSSYCWADKDWCSYTTPDGKGIRELTSYTKLYLCQAISNVDELKSIELNGKYSLVCDLNLQGIEWTPIGSSDEMFTGLFNGSGFTISNFKLTSDADAGMGLFGYNSGIIQNLKITDFTINLSTSDGTVGGLVAYNYGLILDVSTNATIIVESTTTNGYVGGLVGNNAGEIINSYSVGSITATALSTLHVGGLVGINSKTISCSHSNATVSSRSGNQTSRSGRPYNYAGGLVGYNSGNIATSYATGYVASRSYNYSSNATLKYWAVCYAGGLIGYNYNTVTNSYATGNVSAYARMRFDYSSAMDTDNYSTSYAGGLIGYNRSSITNCYALGNVTSSSELASMYGNSNSSDAGPHASYAGGLIGYNNSTISNCFAVGNITISSTIPDLIASTSLGYAGGLVGINNGTITMCSRYSGQTFSVTVSGTYSSNSLGTSRNLSVLQSSSFYNSTIKWDSNVWNIVDGEYPTLN